jgi:hypothetical protein
MAYYKKKRRKKSRRYVAKKAFRMLRSIGFRM